MNWYIQKSMGLLCVLILMIFSFQNFSSAQEKEQKRTENDSIFDEPVKLDDPDQKKDNGTNMKSIWSGEVLTINGYEDVNGWFSQDAVGIEYYGILSNVDGDFLTINIQLRLFFNSEYLETDHSHDFTDTHQHEYGNFSSWDDYNKIVQFHNVYFRFKFLRGYLYVTTGHYDLAYGLEPAVDTHTTLLQKLVFYDFNMKKDWGIIFSGQADAFDYWLGVTIGSGLGFHWEGDQYLISARIASPESESTFGFSVVYGKILPVRGSVLVFTKTQETLRLVADMRLLISEFKIETEIMGGWQQTISKKNMRYIVNSWTPDFGYLIHLSYIPAWANNNLAFTVGSRLIMKDIFDNDDMKVETAKVLTLETNLRFNFLKNFKVEIAYIPELYSSANSLNWDLEILIYINI